MYARSRRPATSASDIRVAGYDSRLTPDIGDFLERTKRLIEDTYRDNGNQPVHLAGHSNGPLYAQYLLTHTSRGMAATSTFMASRRSPATSRAGRRVPADLHRL